MDRLQKFSQKFKLFLRYEKSRLNTFRGWPRSYLIDPKDLAENGFHYAKKWDHCVCVFCDCVISAWEEEDTPAGEHRRHSPNCHFVKGLPVGNVPLRHSDILDQIYLEGEESPIYNFSHESRYEHFVVVPAYKNLDNRIFSFYKRQWPEKVGVEPERLAEAGFFYYPGYGDHAMCFHCGNGLRNWNASHDPWEEHARHYPHCGYVLRVKGRDFVDRVRAAKSEFSPLKPSSGVFRTLTEEQLDVLMESAEIRTVEKEVGIVGRGVLRDILRKRLESYGVPFDNCDQIRNELPRFMLKNVQQKIRRASI